MIGPPPQMKNPITQGCLSLNRSDKQSRWNSPNAVVTMQEPKLETCNA